MDLLWHAMYQLWDTPQGLTPILPAVSDLCSVAAICMSLHVRGSVLQARACAHTPPLLVLAVCLGMLLTCGDKTGST